MTGETEDLKLCHSSVAVYNWCLCHKIRPINSFAIKDAASLLDLSSDLSPPAWTRGEK